MRRCYEVPVIGVGVQGDKIRPDVPDGINWSIIEGDSSKIIVNDSNGINITKATWSGTEAEAAQRWGKNNNDILKLL